MGVLIAGIVRNLADGDANNHDPKSIEGNVLATAPKLQVSAMLARRNICLDCGSCSADGITSDGKLQL